MYCHRTIRIPCLSQWLLLMFTLRSSCYTTWPQQDLINLPIIFSFSNSDSLHGFDSPVYLLSGNLMKGKQKRTRWWGRYLDFLAQVEPKSRHSCTACRLVHKGLCTIVTLRATRDFHSKKEKSLRKGEKQHVLTWKQVLVSIWYFWKVTNTVKLRNEQDSNRGIVETVQWFVLNGIS